MNLKVLLFFVISFALAAIAFGQESPVQQIIAETKTPANYLLGPGDIVEGKVMGEPDFNFTATVDEDGNIEVPFFDKPLMAKCRSEREVRADLAKLLSKYLRSPLVSVRTERRSRPPVVVYGEVRTPQKVDLMRKSTLLELISVSGGETEDAGGMIQVFRTQAPMCSDNPEDSNWIAVNGGTEVPSRIYSLSSLKKGLDEANPVIYPGDVIVVQKASPIYVTGEVRQPSGLLLKGEGLSLYQAVSMLGGPNREAKTKDVKIYRLKSNSKDREIISANYDSIQKGTQKDIMLEPYDIIEVDKAKKSIGQTILEIAVGAGRGGITAVTNGLGSRILY